MKIPLEVLRAANIHGLKGIKRLYYMLIIGSRPGISMEALATCTGYSYKTTYDVIKYLARPDPRRLSGTVNSLVMEETADGGFKVYLSDAGRDIYERVLATGGAEPFTSPTTLEETEKLIKERNEAQEKVKALEAKLKRIHKISNLKEENTDV